MGPSQTSIAIAKSAEEQAKAISHLCTPPMHYPKKGKQKSEQVSIHLPTPFLAVPTSAKGVQAPPQLWGALSDRPSRELPKS
mmetsp:Transcript_18718/g.47359  ORF Transcript_18718/g.47359 Transcript_18718/m.47359 type:complete len:82 (-) Transcript_18718:3105-3350(-)